MTCELQSVKGKLVIVEGRCDLYLGPTGGSSIHCSIQAMNCPGHSDRVTFESLVRTGRSNQGRTLCLARPRSRCIEQPRVWVVHVDGLATEFAEILEESDMQSCGHALANPYFQMKWKNCPNLYA